MIVTEERYKKWEANHDSVAEINHASLRGVPIVSYDWLEDSLFRKRKLAHKPYLMENILKKKRKEKEERKKDENKALTKASKSSSLCSQHGINFDRKLLHGRCGACQGRHPIR